MEHPMGLADSRQKENVDRQIIEAMKEGFSPPKVSWSLPDSDGPDTDTDNVPQDDVLEDDHAQTVSTADENEKDYFWTESGPTPVLIPGAIYRDRSLENMKKASLEYLHDIVEEYIIGFDLTTFPQVVANWIPTLRATALPGSYEHLLLLMFDEVLEFNKFQSKLRDLGVAGFLDPGRDDTLTINPRRDRKEIGRGKGKPRSKVALVPKGRVVQNTQTTDEAYFSRELHILRLMATPLRDEKEEIIWITSREEQPDDMIQQFDAAKFVINDFKKRLIKALHEGPENKAINLPAAKGLESPSYRERRLQHSSLHQFRMDACKASTEWARFPPSETELRRRYGHFGTWHGPHKDAVKPPIENTLPPVRVCSNLGCEFDNVETIHPILRREGRILTLLVQITQWLALARGFSAVHLFCDVIRLFSIHGVDLGNKAQVEICKQLTKFQLMCDALVSPVPLHFPVSSSVTKQFSPTFIQGVIQANRKMEDALVDLNTLYHSVKDISSDSPPQVLEWVTRKGQKVLALKIPRLFDSHAKIHVPFAPAEIFSEEELAAHLDAMDV